MRKTKRLRALLTAFWVSWVRKVTPNPLCYSIISIINCTSILYSDAGDCDGGERGNDPREWPTKMWCADVSETPARGGGAAAGKECECTRYDSLDDCS